MFFWDNLLFDIGEGISKGVSSVGKGIDKAVLTGIDGIGVVEDFVKENPVKSVAVVAATVATGGLGLAFAPSIAATIGATGVLGTTGAGVAIETLTGVALSNASLAALGGGALATGGGGMAAGTTVVACSSAAVGCTASGVTAVVTS